MLFEWILLPSLALLFALIYWRHRRNAAQSAACSKILIDSLPDAVLSVEPDGKISYANAAAVHLLGYDDKELIGLTVEELVPEQQRHHHEHWRARFMDSKRTQPIGMLGTLTARHKSGRSIPVRIRLVPVKQPGSTRPSMLAILYPALENEERLKQVQRDSGVGTWEWDLERDRISWSDSVYEMFGLDPTRFEASYEAYLDVVHPDDRQSVDQAIRMSEQQATPYEIEYRIIRDGEIRSLIERNYLSLNPDGKIQYMWGSIIDVTEKRQTEAQLQLAEAVFKHCAEGILVFSQEEKLVRTNAALLEMAGYEQSEIGHPTAAQLLTHAHTRAPVSLAQLLSGPASNDDASVDDASLDEEWRGELKLHRADGEQIPVLASVSIIEGSQSEARDYIVVCTDIRELKAQQEQLRHQEMHDSLTGLPNRRLFSAHLDQAIATSKRSGKRLAVVYIDLDGFKQVNDTYGHESGDELLCQLAGKLKGLVRESDILARIGGDEFVFILNECGDDQRLTEVLERVIREAATAYRDLDVTLSIGAACYPDHGTNGSDLLILADQAMYRAKSSGKNCCAIADQRRQS